MSFLDYSLDPVGLCNVHIITYTVIIITYTVIIITYTVMHTFLLKRVLSTFSSGIYYFVIYDNINTHLLFSNTLVLVI